MSQSRKKLAPREFAAVAAFCLFLGGGLSLFLWHIHAWFYDYVSTGLAIFLDAVGLLLALASTSGSWAAPRPSRRAGYLLALLVLWLVPAYLYIAGSDLARLVQQSQSARAYWADSSCSGDMMRELAHQPPRFAQSSSDSKDYTQSICKTGWTKVREKASYHSCLLLNGNGLNGEYCGYARFGPKSLFDWGSIQAGDTLVAQTAYGRPAAYFFPTKDLSDVIVHPRGVVFLTSTNPDQEFRGHLSQAILFIGLYLTLGAALATRLVG